ncbi:MAG: DNA primase [Firmicutes bacterium]|nr:DNA primase [Bacillota bacterium]
MSEFSNFISNLLAKTDIVSLISRYVSLQKKGGTHWGCCPLHHEKTPSFTVSDSKQLFYCFGCQTGGNAITFLSKIESIESIEAIKMLAESANIKLPERATLETIDSSENKRRQEALKKILREAAIYYNNNLVSSDNLAKKYLENRKIGQNIVTKFGLGYSKDFSSVIEHLEKLGLSKQDMKYAGLLGQKADKYYDNFAYRLVVPIIDDKGAVRGFGGRILKDEDFAKYKNSPQTDIFDKSEILFAANLVKKRKQREGLPYVIIVEGYMDAIALHNAGFDMTIASMGTALTTRQAKEIKLLLTSQDSKNFSCYISFDGDVSGQKATLKSLDILAAAGLSVKVISLPDKLDPDDVINKHGKDYYQDLIKNATELTIYKLQTLKKDYDLNTFEGKAAYASAAINSLSRLGDKTKINAYLELIQKDTGYPLQVLRKQAEIFIQEETPVPAYHYINPNAVNKSLNDAKEFILSSIIAAQPYANTSDDIFLLLDDVDLQRVYCLINDCLKADIESGGIGQWGANAWGALHQALENNYSQQDIDTITRLASYQHIAGDDAEKFNKSIKVLKVNLIDKEEKKLKEEYDKTKDLNLLTQIKSLTQKRHELK